MIDIYIYLIREQLLTVDMFLDFVEIFSSALWFLACVAHFPTRLFDRSNLRLQIVIQYTPILVKSGQFHWFITGWFIETMHRWQS